ncbi:MAG: hypothetical protein ACR2NZ_16765 [Rubripirellula sp.]
MFAGSLVLGFTLLGFAGWLHWNEVQGWPNESYVTELDKKYLGQRTKSRRRIHFIIAACGSLVIIAAIAGPGVVWIGAWMIVMLALMTVVLLAGVDAMRTHRYQRAKLPEIRRQALGEDD